MLSGGKNELLLIVIALIGIHIYLTRAILIKPRKDYSKVKDLLFSVLTLAAILCNCQVVLPMLSASHTGYWDSLLGVIEFAAFEHILSPYFLIILYDFLSPIIVPLSIVLSIEHHYSSSKLMGTTKNYFVIYGSLFLRCAALVFPFLGFMYHMMPEFGISMILISAGFLILYKGVPYLLKRRAS